MSTVKDQVRELVATLPEDAKVRYEVHVREEIEKGERAIAEARTVPHDEVEKRFSSG